MRWTTGQAKTCSSLHRGGRHRLILSRIPIPVGALAWLEPHSIPDHKQKLSRYYTLGGPIAILTIMLSPLTSSSSRDMITILGWRQPSQTVLGGLGLVCAYTARASIFAPLLCYCSWREI